MGSGFRCCVVVFWKPSSVDIGVEAVEGSLEGDDEVAGGGEGEGECSSLGGVSEDTSDDWLVALAAPSGCSKGVD
jgi:hypothetical protein